MADDWRTPDTEALVDAILRLDDREEAERFLRDLCTLGRAARHRPALGRRPAARRRHALRRDLSAHRRQHGDHHPDRLLAEPRRGRLPGMLDRLKAGDGTPLPDRGRAMRERLRLAVPNKGRLVEPTLSLLHDAGPRLRRARPEPRGPRPEPSTWTSCSCAPTTSSSSSPTASPTWASPACDMLAESGASCLGSATSGYGRCRLAAAVARGLHLRTIADLAGAAGRNVAPEHDSAVLRRPGHRRVEVIPLSGAVEVAPGSASPKRSSISCRPGRRS